jgi:hypothetical protein
MSKEDTKWRLRDSEGKEYIIIDSEKVDMQEELNKMITKQMKEIERLNENNQAMQEELCKVWGERDNAYRRILEAVDNLETPYFRECEQQCKDVINILKGSDK